LFVVALGTIVAYWEDIKELVSGVSEESKKLNELANENLEAENAKTDQLGNQDNILKLQGKSESEILAIKIKQLDANIQAQEAAIQTGEVIREQQIAAAERNRKLLKGIIDFFTYPIRTLFTFATDTIDGIVSVLNKIPGVDIAFKINGKEATEKANSWVAGLIFDPEETKAEGEKVAEEQRKVLLKMQNDRAGLVLSSNAIAKTEADKRKADADKEREEALKAHQEFLSAQRKMNSESQKSEAEEFAEFEKAFADQKAAKDKLAREQEIQAEKWAEENVKKKREAELAAIALDQAKKDQQIANIQIVSGALGTLADVVGRQTVAGKALAVAQATIDGFLGVQKALASAPPPFNFIAAAAVGAAALINIKKIVSTKIPGQSGGGGAVPNLAPAGAPPIPQAQVSTTQLDSNSLNAIGNAAYKTYVVSSEVSSDQEMIRRVNRAARLS
jgi:hypothetical protein